MTTHYIEETVASDTVSFMRNGRLICEKNPQHLISTSASVSLEEALYKLCKQQDIVPFSGQIDQKPKSQNSEKITKEIPFPVRKNERLPSTSNHVSLTAISAVCMRTWKLLIADKLNLFLMLIYPSIVLYMISVSFHQLPDVDVAILNDDQFIVGGETIISNQTRSFAHKLLDSMANTVHLVSVKSKFHFQKLVKIFCYFVAPRKQH